MSESDAKTETVEGLVPEADDILAGSGDDGRETNEEALARQLIDARREQEEQRQGMLRALAESENVRRRAQRDVADAKSFAITSFARDLLSVADNFKRALDALPQADELPEELRGLVEGIQMTERELLSALDKHGVKIVDPVGERFDPNRHQAMFEIENTDIPSGTVIQVMQAGAVLGERTLRPAMVGVSKGGPKADAKPVEPPEEGGAEPGGGAEEAAG
ncbi:MAG: nucleotide exchange factor GrpE [Pseudomonadota bacterium]